MIKIKKTEDVESLNAFLADQIKGGNLSSLEQTNADFTCIYDRKTREQEGWEDDSNGNPIRRLPD